MKDKEVYSNSKVLKRMIKELKETRKIVITLIIILLIIITALATIIPRINGKILTEISMQLINKVSLDGTMKFERINIFLIVLILIYIMQYILTYINNNLLIEACQNYVVNLRKKINNKISSLPTRYFNKKSNGEILTLMVNDSENISGNIYTIIRETSTELFNIIGTSIMLFTISPILLFVNSGIIIISFIIILALAKKSQEHFMAKQKKIADLNSNIEEVYTARSIIKIFNRQNTIEKKLGIENKKLKNISIKAKFIASISGSVMNFMENVSIAIAAVVSAILIINGELEIGYIHTVISYTKTMINPLVKIANINIEIMNLISSARRIYQFLDEEEIKRDNNVIEFKNNICIDSVWFAYEKNNYILKDVSMNIEKGQKIAIIGRTGIGKTTITKLLMKLYDVNKGKIKMDGIDINDVNIEQYIKNFSVISQDINLFTDTVMENIKYGNENISDEEVIQIAKEIGIHDVFSDLDNGYDTQIKETNNNISEGVKQLVVLMQVIVSKSPILILDEATNMLDVKTEEKINYIMNYMKRTKTLIIIAHKIETIKDADVIYAMHDGNIIEKGTYNQLVTKGIISEKNS